LQLQELDFSVHHIPGKENTIADALSRCLVVIDKEEEIRKVHGSIIGHHGISRTIKLLKDNGKVWPKMRQDVVQFIRGCSACQKSRMTVKECFDTDYHVIESFSPFEEVSIDYMVGLPKDVEGFEIVLVVVDNFQSSLNYFLSKQWMQCQQQSVWSRYGHIKSIRSDRGSNFIGEVCKELLQLCGTSQVLTVGFRPQANGIVERFEC
jgi:Fe-S cluster biogenesis protein NfuA